jgi:acyl-[acyl carrier protein]--UDP-N-acetylglucosamine O-acyltransferase
MITRDDFCGSWYEKRCVPPFTKAAKEPLCPHVGINFVGLSRRRILQTEKIRDSGYL